MGNTGNIGHKTHNEKKTGGEPKCLKILNPTKTFWLVVFKYIHHQLMVVSKTIQYDRYIPYILLLGISKIDTNLSQREPACRFKR